MAIQDRIDKKGIISGIVHFVMTVGSTVIGMMPAGSAAAAMAGSAAGVTVTTAVVDLGLEVWKSYRSAPPAMDDGDTEKLEEHIQKAWAITLIDLRVYDMLKDVKLSSLKSLSGMLSGMKSLDWDEWECLEKYALDQKPDEVIGKDIFEKLKDWKIQDNENGSASEIPEHELERLQATAKAITRTFFNTLRGLIKKDDELYSRLAWDRIIQLLHDQGEEHKAQSAALDMIVTSVDELREELHALQQQDEIQNARIAEALDTVVSKLDILVSFLENVKRQQEAGNAGTKGDPGSVFAEEDFFNLYPVRKLGENLWINWSTGHLAADMEAARTDASISANTDIRIDANASTVSAGKTKSAASADKTAGAARSDETSVDAGAAKTGTACTDDDIDFPELATDQLRLLSVLVQGEGAVVSWEELFWRGRLIGEWRERFGNPMSEGYDRNLQEQMGTSTADGWETPGTEDSDKKAQKEGRKPSREEIIEIVTDAVEEIREEDGRLAAIIRQSDNGKGYLISLPVNGIEEDPERFPIDTVCLPKEDWKRLKDEKNSRIVKTDEDIVYICHTRQGRQAWLRRYYSSLCRSFEKRISNSKKEGNEKEIFGNYTMVQAYTNAYIQEENPVGSMPDRSFREMLDFVERWYLAHKGYSTNTENPGNVLVLHGQPGDGKTTFCKKAVYAHCMEGWLEGAPHVLCLSLNPSDSDLAKGGKLKLKNAFCITDENDNTFLLDLNEEEAAEGKAASLLDGSLIILDGYDELSADLANDPEADSLNAFCEKVEDLAAKHSWKVIITSRTMCIEKELKTGAFRNPNKRRAAAFAPMGAEQQEAMIDRMIELDKAEEMTSVGTDGVVSVDNTDNADSADTSVRKRGNEDRTANEDTSSDMQPPMSLEKYKEKVLRPLWENDEDDTRTKDFKELLKVPTLFRMIVARRFVEFDQTETVAELYGRLFHSLLRYKGKAGKETDKGKEGRELNLVEKYEKIAVRIFNYDDDTCPFSGEEEKDQDLLYLFYTKRGKTEGGSGRLGFLHRSFYQYFLARYIVSAMRHNEYAKGEPVTPKDLFVGLRVEKLKDPDLWKLVSQLAELEQDQMQYPERNADEGRHSLIYHRFEKRIQNKHIMDILEFLNCERNVLEAMMAEIPSSLERSGRRTSQDTRKYTADEKRDGSGTDDPARSEETARYENPVRGVETEGNIGDDDGRDEGRTIERIPMREAENAVFNLLCACAASEKGIHKKDGVAYVKYPNVCELLRRGDYDDICMEGVNLDGCCLENASLAGAHLVGASLNGARLDGVNLSGADLREAYLERASLLGAKLSKAVLDGAHLDNAKLHSLGAWRLFENTRSGTIAPDPSSLRLEGADLEEASLKGAWLRWTNLSGANLDRADLEEAHLEAAFLDGASLLGADLREAWLNDRKGVREHEPSPRAILYAADLRQADLEEAWMEGVDLFRANLEGARLASTHLKKAVLARACLDGALLEGADLTGAKLKNASLEEAYLKGAKLDENTLQNLEGASLRGACFDEDQIKLAKSSGITELEARTMPEARTMRSMARKDRSDIIRRPADQTEAVQKPADQTEAVQKPADQAEAVQKPADQKKAVQILTDRTQGKGDCILRSDDLPEARELSAILRSGRKVKVFFGSYPQSRKADSGSWIDEPLLWRMLEVDEDNGRALLISDKIIDCKKYHEKYDVTCYDVLDVTWERCTLRQWMNNEFAHKAFNAEELSRVAKVWNENPDNEDYEEFGEGGYATQDRVFALSLAEARSEDYFKDNKDRRAVLTPYAEDALKASLSKQTLWSFDEATHVDSAGKRTGWWWLRSPGDLSDPAAYVCDVGDVLGLCLDVDGSSVSVRPALWLNL